MTKMFNISFCANAETLGRFLVDYGMTVDGLSITQNNPYVTAPIIGNEEPAKEHKELYPKSINQMEGRERTVKSVARSLGHTGAFEGRTSVRIVATFIKENGKGPHSTRVLPPYFIGYGFAAGSASATLSDIFKAGLIRKWSDGAKNHHFEVEDVDTFCSLIEPITDEEKATLRAANHVEG